MPESAPHPAPAHDPHAPAPHFGIGQVFTLFGVVVAGTLLSLGVAYGFRSLVGESEDSYSYDDSGYASSGEIDFSGCRVVGIDLRGQLGPYGYSYSDDGMSEDITSSEDIAMILEDAAADDSVEAVFLQVDSGGGIPVAGEEIARAVAGLGKPSVALIRSIGASAAYWAILPADTIIASEVSDVGSIGATYSFLDTTGENESAGRVFQKLSTGEFKDTGNPDKPLTDRERSLIMRDLEIVRDAFVRAVSQYRGLLIEQVEALADGSTLLGAAAKEAGLIDVVGGRPEAMAALREALDGDDPEICWPQY